MAYRHNRSIILVYKVNKEMKVQTLKEFGEKRFIQELFKLRKANHLYDRRNQDWFENLIVNWDDAKFKEWFFLVDGDAIAAFATIQEYYPNCYRMLTRSYIYRYYRRFTNPKVDTFYSPTMRLLARQMDYIKGYDTLFVSMQDLSRRPALERYGKKLEYRTDLEWKMSPDMMLTALPPYKSECWQSVIYTGKKPNLKEMSINEWKERYGR